MLGGWKVNVSKNMPQKVASAFGKLSDLLGVEYNAIAYLGSQEVNGVNHAVLAEQTVLTGKDSKNVVVLIFNEKPGEMEATLIGVEQALQSGGELGGVKIEIEEDLSEDANSAFNSAFEGFVGSKVEPIALLGTQVTKGTNYIFAVKLTTVTANPVEDVAIAVVNNLVQKVTISGLLKQRASVDGFGYAFNWLKS